MGAWHVDGDREQRSWIAQAGVTPFLRFTAQDWDAHWFVEAGIGANVIAPRYRNRDKQFSTTFNFGDHLGVGFRLGPQREHEVALRVEHFSNCAIRHPNPGENFGQLRYLRWF
jgi:hypothetical protein